MNYGFYMLSVLSGLAVAFSIYRALGARRRAAVSPVIWWACLVIGVVAGGYGLSHSTVPSFAPRVTAVGTTYDFYHRKSGKDSWDGFRFVPDGGGAPILMETEIMQPGWATPSFNGRTIRVTYLQDEHRSLKNEVIEEAILTGTHAGYHDAYDARPFGRWLFLPLGGAIAGLGYLGLRSMGDDDKKVAAEADEGVVPA